MKNVGNTLRTAQEVRSYEGIVYIDGIIADLETELEVTLQAKNKHDIVNGTVATVQEGGNTKVIISYYLEDADPEPGIRGRKSTIKVKKPKNKEK